MVSAPCFLHMDSDYSWRWYITDADGALVAVSRPFFNLAEAQQVLRAYAMPLAA
jgi:hypothetical protein